MAPALANADQVESRTHPIWCNGNDSNVYLPGFNRALYLLQLPSQNIRAPGLPGPGSPHRLPDSTAVLLHSPLYGQAVTNSHTTGPGPNPVLPHRRATPVREYTCAGFIGSNPKSPDFKAALSPLQPLRHSYGRADGTRTHNLPLIWRTGYKPAALPLSYSPIAHFPNHQKTPIATRR